MPDHEPPLSDDEQRELAAFKTRTPSRFSLPRGCVPALLTLLGVFFLILGLCHRG